VDDQKGGRMAKWGMGGRGERDDGTRETTRKTTELEQGVRVGEGKDEHEQKKREGG